MIFPPSFSSNDIEDRIFPQITMALICCYCLLVSFVNLGRLYLVHLFRPFLLLIVFAIFWIPFSKNGIGDSFVSFVSFLKLDMGILYMFAVYLMLIKYGEKMEKYLFLMYFIQVLYVFYCLVVEKRAAIESNEKIFDSNSGFMLVCCIPMALLIPFKRFRIYLVLLLTAGCLISGQRSAALAAVLSLPFCFLYLKDVIARKDYLYIGVLFLLLGLPILVSAVDNIVARNNIDLRHGSVGSGREIFWLIVWKSFWGGDFVNVLLGNGLDSVPTLLKRKYGMAIGAHNGWLDHLYSFGLLGICFYIYTFILLFKSNYLVRRYYYKFRGVLAIAALLFLVKSLTSHGYWDIASNPLTGMISFVVYKYYYDQSDYYDLNVYYDTEVSNYIRNH